jgi:stearoyl-CoA desaturase (delta-9 desaturase)
MPADTIAQTASSDEAAGLVPETMPVDFDNSDLKPATPLSESARAKAEIWEALDPSQLRWNNIDWVVFGFTASVHLGALAAPFFFSWSGLAACIILHWVTCSIGVCLGYHRCLAHKSLKLRQPTEFLTLVCGSLSGEGSPLQWAATHRVHHQRSDLKGDPHSPFDGTFWSHITWLFVRHKPTYCETLYKQYAPELAERPLLQFFQKTQVFWLVACGLVLLALGGLSMLLWGMCVRMVFAYHSTWFVNSATHLWGYRNYDTRDESRNLWWVALLSYGEGWHNNHHAHPSLAPAGHRWWEIDMTWWAIKFLKAIGQAYDVRDNIPERTNRETTESTEIDTLELEPALSGHSETPVKASVA